MPPTEDILLSLIEKYRETSSIRPGILFREFLPVGYRSTTLSSVDERNFDSVLLAKIHLGMMITLYDDLADHPRHRNSELLAELYTLNIGRDRPTPGHLKVEEKRTFELARFLFSSLRSILMTFEHLILLEPVLYFDIEQFFACNRHSELMTLLPSVRCLTESRTLGPHNMGIVAAGTIDLMASATFESEELGHCRDLFHLGQRLGRISNLIYTFERETREGDVTNEIAIANATEVPRNHRTRLHGEFRRKLRRIRTNRLRSFETNKYAEGFEALHHLHASLEGRI